MATKSVLYSDPSAPEPVKVKVVEGDPKDEALLSVELPSGAVAQVMHTGDEAFGAARWGVDKDDLTAGPDDEG